MDLRFGLKRVFGRDRVHASGSVGEGRRRREGEGVARKSEKPPPCRRRLPVGYRLVRLIRLELTRIAAPDPKSGVSTIPPQAQENGAKVRIFFGIRGTVACLSSASGLQFHG